MGLLGHRTEMARQEVWWDIELKWQDKKFVGT